ncbi:unnamed protein product [Caenorhabditis sp. 36 PRJEB53466]|nr:unnamed protein product [Caenorhabditis sp. 36 PRJEB53466]
MSQTPFRLFNLAYPTLRLAVRNMNLMDLLRLSTTSPAAWQFVRDASIHPLHVLVRIEPSETGYVEITVHERQSLRLSIERNLEMEEYAAAPLLPPHTVEQILTAAVLVAPDSTCDWCVSVRDTLSVSPVIIRIVNYIMALFPCKVTEFHYRPEMHESLPRCLDALHIRELDVLTVRSTGQQTFPSDFLAHVLEEVIVRDKLDVMMKVAQEQQDDPINPLPFHQKKLLMDSGAWFTGEHLLSSDCERIELYETCVTFEDLNKYIKNWMDGCYEHLQLMILLGDENWHLDDEALLNGINTSEYDASRREYFNLAFYREDEDLEQFSDTSHRDLELCVDVTRADGTSATILYERQLFRFLVWGQWARLQ